MHLPPGGKRKGERETHNESDGEKMGGRRERKSVMSFQNRQ